MTDYFVNSDEEALEKIRESIFYLNNDETTYRRDYSTNDLELKSFMKRSNLQNENLTLDELITTISDNNFHEFKSKYGDNEYFKVGIGKINKEHSVGFFLLNDCKSGSVSSKDFIKASHFVQLCTQRNYPIVFFIKGGKTDDVNIMKPFANMMKSIGASSVPKIAFLMGTLENNLAMMFGSRSFEVNFLFSWPFFGGSKKDELPALKFTSLANDDNLIDPADSLFVLHKCLKIIKQSIKPKVNALDIHYMTSINNNNNNNVYRF